MNFLDRPSLRKTPAALPPDGALRVWWIPQIPGKPFYVPVTSLVEAKLLLDALAAYQKFPESHCL